MCSYNTSREAWSLMNVKSRLFDQIWINFRGINLQCSRGARRSCAPRPYWPQRKYRGDFRQHLTKDNVAFLKEAEHDRYAATESPLKEQPVARNQWTRRTWRTGVLGIKIGVQPMWTKSGKKFTTTLIQILDNHVVRYITPEDFGRSENYKEKWSKGYGAVIVGALSCEPTMFKKDYNNLFLEAGIPPKRKLARFMVTPDAAIAPGTPLNVNHFRVGDVVDVQAKTIGHGFQGVVKRWGFKGGPASHGTTKAHRRRGATGGGGDKAAIWKGTKMPGHMGMEYRYLKGLKIWRINRRYNVLYVTGQNLPGPTHCYIRVMDTRLPLRKPSRENGPPMPTWYPDDVEEELPEEMFDEDLFQFDMPSITLEEEDAKAARRS